MKEIKTEKLKETAIDNIGYIGAFVILLAIIIAGFVLFDFNEDGKVNWADVLFNGVLGIVAFMLSRQQGIINGTKLPTHQSNFLAYGKKVSALIENNGIDGIEEFCRERTKLREQEVRENIMLKVCSSETNSLPEIKMYGCSSTEDVLTSPKKTCVPSTKEVIKSPRKPCAVFLAGSQYTYKNISPEMAASCNPYIKRRSTLSFSKR